ncbi:hypothetical protein Aple_016140 [Acrocarpospora pleiomorpha]|uniref:Uncharacterized protein n=1 Tax=Acrocarpospora pleiomorpha TaxID=90975 RepID=A0A5M3XF03_9ACTN|nr:hypothetical protein [Acrocarpospora pleiomorpha]GES18719.1 hypothetical protein Aple_016140 [Acrocarpospora pleiomorpha]
MDRAVTGIHGRRKSILRRLTSAAVAVLAVAFLCVPPASALALPTPKDLTAFLDLECFKTNPYQPPATTLTLRHINPVLGNLPIETVTLGQREQLCVPVAKNTQMAPSPAIDFIRYIDLACYKISGTTVTTGLVLSHLNPLFQTLPRTQISMNTPQQLCVPVIKNNVVPPAEVLSLIRHIDLKCYAITPNNPLNQQLSLRQLNPVLTPIIPTHGAQVLYARQLCVPVQKAGDNIPAEVFNIVRWIDLEKFDLVTPALPTVSLTLRHINPVLAGLPVEQATLTGASQLALPVAKNGNFPPG